MQQWKSLRLHSVWEVTWEARPKSILYLHMSEKGQRNEWKMTLQKKFYYIFSKDAQIVVSWLPVFPDFFKIYISFFVFLP